MIALGPIVHEADDLVAQLAVLDDLVRDETPQFTRTGDENTLEAQPGAPPSLEHLSHEQGRPEGNGNVQNQKQAPNSLGNLEGAGIVRRDVRLHVQRRDDTEDNREDAADEDREEIVYPRAATPQPVQALQVETQ